jgi:hypothetical protein
VTRHQAKVALVLAGIRGTPYVLWLAPEWKRAFIVFGTEEEE